MIFFAFCWPKLTHSDSTRIMARPICRTGYMRPLPSLFVRRRRPCTSRLSTNKIHANSNIDNSNNNSHKKSWEETRQASSSVFKCMCYPQVRRYTLVPPHLTMDTPPFNITHRRSNITLFIKLRLEWLLRASNTFLWFRYKTTPEADQVKVVETTHSFSKTAKEMICRLMQF